MATIAVFHSALGVREGVRDAARRLRDAGHDPHIVDYYGDERSFDDLTNAVDYVNEVGFPALMQAAIDAVADLPDGFAVLGFSNGSGVAEYVAIHRSVTKAVLGSGTLPLAMMGADTWPSRTAAQIHYAAHDPFRNEDWLESVIDSVRNSGAPLEVYTEYPGNGHLFTDSSLPDYDEANTELFWKRVTAFLGPEWGLGGLADQGGARSRGGRRSDVERVGDVKASTCRRFAQRRVGTCDELRPDRER